MNPLDTLLAEYAPEILTIPKGGQIFRDEQGSSAYLVLSGTIDVYTPGVGAARYLVGRVEAGDFLGEWLLLGQSNKAVSTEVSSSEAIVRIISNSTIEKMRSERKDDYIALLHAVLARTRERMNLANCELGLIHDIVREISEHPEAGRKGLNAILSFMHKLFKCSAVVLCEAHPDIPHLWTYTYDSRFARTRVLEKAWDEVRELTASLLENRGQFRNISSEHALHGVRLISPESREIIAAIVFARPHEFSSVEMRTLNHFAPTLASILRTVNE